jgi:hypothetical protein
MRRAALAAFLLLGVGPAFAGYDASWYRSEGWPGEYPTGFSVIGTAVTLAARTDVDRDLPRSLSCAVPQKAVFHPWNGKRKARFVTMQKVAPMTAKEDLTIGVDNTADVKKGEIIDFVVPGAEGSFTARYKGQLYEGDQSVFDSVTVDEALLDTRDLWIGIACAGGATGWLMVDELKDSKSRSGWASGLGSWEPGRIDYGKVRDLTDAEVRKLAK